MHFKSIQPYIVFLSVVCHTIVYLYKLELLNEIFYRSKNIYFNILACAGKSKKKLLFITILGYFTYILNNKNKLVSILTNGVPIKCALVYFKIRVDLYQNVHDN